MLKNERIEQLDNGLWWLTLKNPVPHLATDAGSKQSPLDAVPANVAHSDVTRVLVEEPDLTIVATDLFKRYVPHIDFDPVVADGWREQSAMDFRREIKIEFQRLCTVNVRPQLSTGRFQRALQSGNALAQSFCVVGDFRICHLSFDYGGLT